MKKRYKKKYFRYFATHVPHPPKKLLFDHVVIVAAFMYPLSSLPQLISILGGYTEGVSIYSWAAFTCFSSLFLCYGWVHKIKPMIISNTIWVCVDLAIVTSLVLQRMV